MFSVFAKNISPYFKFKPKEVSVDNLIFKFHYRWTFVILLTSTVLVTSRQYIGEHIRCIEQSGKLSNVIETFCFFTTTFTLIRFENQTYLDEGIIPHPGVGTPQFEEDPIKRHAYYQWVPFVLFGQALIFYIPHFIWKKYEGGKIYTLVNGLRRIKMSKYTEKDIKIGNITIPSKASTDSRISKIKQTFYKRLQLNVFWGPTLILCEILNLLNIFLNIYWTNRFLNGQFYDLGPQVMTEKWNGKMDALDVVFPKVTKCHFHKFGPSGTIQLHDALCIMALNVINEKIYTFLWFWFVFLIIASSLAIVWRFFTILLHKNTTFNGYIFSYASPGRLNRHHMKTVTDKCNFSNWMFLYFLASNLDGYIFRDVLTKLVDEIRNESNANSPDTEQEDLNNKFPHDPNTDLRRIDEVDSGTILLESKKK